MNAYISGLILESKDYYNEIANLKGIFLDAWNRNDERTLEHFSRFYRELEVTITTQQEPIQRIRMMALYVICQLTGVLICKGYKETEINIDLLSYYYKIDQAQTTEDILDELRNTCLYIIEYHNRMRNTERVPELIMEVMEYIDGHVEEKISLQMVCRELRYSSSYVSHEFSKAMKCTFSEYVQKRKLEKAKEMLSMGHSIDEVANNLCFSSTSHFITFFRKHMNVTPRQFVKWLQAG